MDSSWSKMIGSQTALNVPGHASAPKSCGFHNLDWFL